MLPCVSHQVGCWSGRCGTALLAPCSTSNSPSAHLQRPVSPSLGTRWAGRAEAKPSVAPLSLPLVNAWSDYGGRTCLGHTQPDKGSRGDPPLYVQWTQEPMDSPEASEGS